MIKADPNNPSALEFARRRSKEVLDYHHQEFLKQQNQTK